MNTNAVVNPKSTWQTALSASGLSLRALARETGISHTYLRQIVAGQQLPSEPIRLRLLLRFKDYRSEDLFGPLLPASQTAPAILCKRCRSSHTIKSGLLQGNQRYQCKDCGCVFIDNNAPLHGRLPVAAAVTVMELFFAGQPLDSIRTLVEESQRIQITVSGLEKMVYRLARKAVNLAADILPEIGSRWVLDGDSIPAARPVIILDVLDLDSGFIIASDIIRQDYAEKDRESVVQKALRTTGFTPAIIILGAGLSQEYANLEDATPFQVVKYNPCQEANARRYADSMTARTRLLSRRLSFDSIANHRLFCAAWRVHYNYLSAFQPAPGSPYQSWLDIINAADYPADL